MQIILYAFLAYILYVFIFRFVIPVYLATRKIKKGFRQMQEQMQQKMQEQQQQYQANTAGPAAQSSDNRPKAGDYIDFEEVK